MKYTKLLFSLSMVSLLTTGCGASLSGPAFIVTLANKENIMSVNTTEDYDVSNIRLELSSMPSFGLYTYKDIDFWGLHNPDVLYSVGANRNASGKATSLNYFKYTFFVTSLYDEELSYTFSVKLKTTVGNPFIDILRVVHLNENVDGEPMTVYAKRSKESHESYGYDESEMTNKEYVSYISPDEAREDRSSFPGLAEEFVNDTTAIEKECKYLFPYNSHMHTLVFYLEKWDEQTTSDILKRGKDIHFEVIVKPN